MHLVNGAKFLNITALFLSSNLFAVSSSPVPVIVVLNLISLLVYVSLDSSFISTQFPVQNLDG